MHKDQEILHLGVRSREVNLCIALHSACRDICRSPPLTLQVDALLIGCLATAAQPTVIIVDARVNDYSGVLGNAALRICSVSQWQHYFLISIAPTYPFDFSCACGPWALTLTALFVVQGAVSLHGTSILADPLEYFIRFSTLLAQFYRANHQRQRNVWLKRLCSSFPE